MILATSEVANKMGKFWWNNLGPNVSFGGGVGGKYFYLHRAESFAEMIWHKDNSLTSILTRLLQYKI